MTAIGVKFYYRNPPKRVHVFTIGLFMARRLCNLLINMNVNITYPDTDDLYQYAKRLTTSETIDLHRSLNETKQKSTYQEDI